MTKPPRLLVIAGSDSGGGAGLQADIKTATMLGCYAMTAVTAVTSQDTRRVRAVFPLPARLVREQILLALNDIGADAVKIGMLATAEIADAVATVLKKHAREIPVVLDPVMVSTSGRPLLEKRAMPVMKRKLIPLAALVTPNIPEAHALTGLKAARRADAEKAGR